MSFFVLGGDGSRWAGGCLSVAQKTWIVNKISKRVVLMKMVQDRNRTSTRFHGN